MKKSEQNRLERILLPIIAVYVAERVIQSTCADINKINPYSTKSEGNNTFLILFLYCMLMIAFLVWVFTFMRVV